MLSTTGHDHLRSDASMTYEEYSRLVHNQEGGDNHPHNIRYWVNLIQQSLKESLENDRQKEAIFSNGYNDPNTTQFKH